MIQNAYSPAFVFIAVDMTLSQTSDTINKLGNTKVGLEFAWTGNPLGTLAVLVGDQNDVTKAVPLTLTGLTPAFNQPSGSAATQVLDLVDLNEAYMWVTYAPTSGSGALTVQVTVNP